MESSELYAQIYQSQLSEDVKIEEEAAQAVAV
jgi:hypothetical protein